MTYRPLAAKPLWSLASLIVSLLLAMAGAPVIAAAEPAGAEAPAAGSPDAAWTSEDVRYANGGLELAAELLLPAPPAAPAASSGLHPGAVILQGSGTSDRSNGWSRLIAEELVGEGIAVLLTDKRGSGASGGDWRTAGFDDLAGDALAGFTYLRGRPEVDPARVGLVGLSQGGWVAPVAAARAPDVAFVIDVSGATVSFGEQSFHEMGNTARQAGLSDEMVQEVLDLNRAAGVYAAGGPWEPYAAGRTRGLERPWAAIAEGFPAERDAQIWTFLRKVIGFSPTPYWLAVTAPVLVVYGAEDEQDNVPVAESVRRLEYLFASSGKTDYRIVVIPGTGHGLLTADRRALHEEFVTALRGWVRGVVSPPAG